MKSIPRFPFERTCPYSAIREYHDKLSRRGSVLDIPDQITNQNERRKLILEKLKTSDYGRCVYRMDNDQPDHYISSIRFGDSITANFSMEAFTGYAGRRTRVFGSMGDMVGDMNELIVTDFRTGKEVKFRPQAEDVEGYKDAGHGGGDFILAHDFAQAVGHQDKNMLTSTIENSIESHMMCFMAEESRKTGKIMKISV